MNDSLLLLIAAVLGVALGYVLRLLYAQASGKRSEMQAGRILEESRLKAESIQKEAELQARKIADRARTESDQEIRERKQEVTAAEKRLAQREESLDRKLEAVDRKDRDLSARDKAILAHEQSLAQERSLVEQARQEQKKALERIAGISADEARRTLLIEIEKEARQEAAAITRRVEQEARELGDRKARDILSVAIQRVAADHTAEITTSSVPIPNDEIKGRIIGREGRNIRAFEQATGVDLIIDDTPEAITISAFDGVRRETARQALQKLVADGRIHPGRIEEVVEKVKKDMEVHLREIGEQAALEAGVPGLHPEILRLLGKLKYRTSYGQNQLQHTLEVTWLCGTIAAELGIDVMFTKRAGLLHDIGKAVDHEVEGTHHQLSADIAKKYGEPEKMLNAIISHHEGIEEPRSAEAFIVAAADAISAARPGARRESVELYLKRLEKLEKLATSFRGVASAFAIQAGREVRILVEPEDIDDRAAQTLAHDIAKKVETELEYPGQIKITVIRETRAQEIAK